MKNAKRMCSGVDKKVKEQAVTLASAVIAMQEKIDSQIEVYNEMPLAQTVTSTQGEKVLKANPVTAEFRATVKDYAAALNNLQDIIENNRAETSKNALTELQKKFRVVQ
jgi:hypothetical protein